MFEKSKTSSDEVNKVNVNKVSKGKANQKI